jgi:hypothetical protein
MGLWRTTGVRPRSTERETSISSDEGPIWARTLEAVTDRAGQDDVVRRSDLGFGDRVIVRTRNSVYSLWVLSDGAFAVSGGWFDRQGCSPAEVRINGCTYGGRAICQDVVAGRGLFLEFGNNVATTRIQDVRVLRFHRSEPALA